MTDTEQRHGRPRVKLPKTGRVTAPVTPEQQADIEQKARDLGFDSIASYLRSLLGIK